MALEYKFVELSIVTDESIEEAVNAWVSRGWQLEGIRFVTTEASRNQPGGASLGQGWPRPRQLPAGYAAQLGFKGGSGSTSYLMVVYWDRAVLSNTAPPELPKV